MKQSKSLIEEGMSSTIIIKGFRLALKMSLDRIKEVSVKIGDKTPDEKRELLMKCAETSLNSKIISKQKSFFSKMVVDAVEAISPECNK